MSIQPATNKPLADQVRPEQLLDVIGQEHLVGENQFLRAIIERGQPVSMILWGPPGSGKTTLARIIAKSSGYNFEEISAVTSGIADVKKVIQRAQDLRQVGGQTILFVDEIHRFNKAQQDAFLPHVEDGTIVLIGATTENPSFEVIGPLLSRSRVVTLNALSPEQLTIILTRAMEQLQSVRIGDDAKEMLADLANGDARVALNGLEAAAGLTTDGIITSELVKQALQKTALRYDKTGEYHYNLISAYIKSMRGNAVDAALFYLARMLESGEDPKFIARRIVIFAAEDIGMAAPAALNLAVSTFMAVERIGMPESQIILSEATIVMAKSPKDRSSYDAIKAAQKAVLDHPGAEVPLHLRNAPTGLMKELGYGKDYKWKPGFEHHEGFMPEELKDIKFYRERPQ